MRVAVYSDLHLEFDVWHPPATLDADVIILAGDIFPGPEGVEWARLVFTQPVIYVPGNHDFWTGDEYRKTLALLRKAAAKSHVHVLHNDAVVIDGWRFVGSTLWTDYNLHGTQPLSMFDAQQLMVDFAKIKGPQKRPLMPLDLLEEFNRSKVFIDRELRTSVEPIIVVTHHAPSAKSIHPRYQNNRMSPAFASSLEHLMGEPARLWVHGHTHDSFDYTVDSTRVVANPRGYAPNQLNPGFQENFVITLD